MLPHVLENIYEAEYNIMMGLQVKTVALKIIFVLLVI